LFVKREAQVVPSEDVIAFEGDFHRRMFEAEVV